jgi:hypothetical protein
VQCGITHFQCGDGNPRREEPAVAGGPLPPDYEYQFFEEEHMKEDEHDLFLTDPSDFVIRCYLPRVYRATAPLKKLPSLSTMYLGFEGLTPVFASADFVRMAQSLHKAGREMRKFRKTVGDSYEELAFLCFPAFAPVTIGGVGGAPFDTVSSFLRSMHGSMVDMYRWPYLRHGPNATCSQSMVAPGGGKIYQGTD